MDRHLYSVDAIIDYRTLTDSVRTIRVTRVEADVKNGRPGFEGVVLDGPETGMNVWGYDDQITRVH